MYTDLSKIKKTDISIPKGTRFYLFKDGRIGTYTYNSLNIYNMTTFKVELTIDDKTFCENDDDYSLWGELVCLTELSNGYLVLGFGRGLEFTNMIINIKDNKPQLIEKFEISDADYCCRKLLTINIGEKEYFIAGDYKPQIFKANKPFKEVVQLNMIFSEMIQIKDTNLLAFIEDNKFSVIDLTDIEKDKQAKEVKTIIFEKGKSNKLLQYNDEIIVLDKKIIHFINLKNYNDTYIELDIEFYSLINYQAMCLLFNDQLLLWSSYGDLLKIDIEKKEIIQKFNIDAKASIYYYQCFSYGDKYLLFADEDKLYEINYNEKEEIKDYDEKEPKYTLEDFKKDQDKIVKKIIEEKDLKKQEWKEYCKAPYIFYDIYRYKSLKKEFPMFKEGEILSLSMKEYNNLDEKNQKFFKDLSEKDKLPPKLKK